MPGSYVGRGLLPPFQHTLAGRLAVPLVVKILASSPNGDIMGELADVSLPGDAWSGSHPGSHDLGDKKI